MYLPRQALGFLLYFMKRIDKTRLKEFFFCFVRGIDAEQMTQEFWIKHEAGIQSWYLQQKSPQDLVISASPAFLLEPVCRSLGILRPIASQVDAKTGKFCGKNCRGAEKVRRFAVEYPNEGIQAFYSDSVSDLPLARIADEAFLIKKGQVFPWETDAEKNTSERPVKNG